MGKYVNYNELLDTLFKQWKNSYNKDVRDKFCLDGLVYKNDSSIDVDSLWGQSSRRVAFLLKDCPDGYGYDTRELLLDKIGIEKAYKNRELKVKFMKNLAKLLYGLLEMKSDYVLNDKDVDNRMPKVIDCWNSKPFVFIESKKLAGGKTVNERAIEDALLLDEVFLKKETQIFKPIAMNISNDWKSDIKFKGNGKTKSELIIVSKTQNESESEMIGLVKKFFYSIGDMNNFKVNVNYTQIEEVIEDDFLTINEDNTKK